MDTILKKRLQNLEKQNEILKQSRGTYLLKEAERKHFEAQQIRDATGKSHAEKTVNAQAMPQWKEFQQELAELESAFEFEKLRYDILDKAFQAEYLTYKIEESVIRKQGA